METARERPFPLWTPSSQLFSTSDNRHMVIDADLTEYPDGTTRFIRRDTVVLYCSEDGEVTDMIPDHIYPPGTTPEQVLADLGYTLEAP